MISDTELDVPIGLLAAEHPGYIPLFERHGINYWSESQKPLMEAAVEKALDPEDLLRDLKALGQVSGQGCDTAWTRASLRDLVAHIDSMHHAFLKDELPELSVLIGKVMALHSEELPHLRRLDKAFEWLRSDLEMFIRKEEMILFPMCIELEQARTRPRFHTTTIRVPIEEMLAEHRSAAHALQRMYLLTNRFTAPAGACEPHQNMLERLSRLNSDLHRHLHEEDNILFVRAVELESRLPLPA